ncbi:MAG: hypothetical protein PHS66_05610 [Candidatus Omnitrophica bacterium]|nr:hypothetical protein [Candidatus Omnitrophota bacterium]
MKSKTRKILSLILSIGLLFQQTSFAQVAAELNIAGYFSKTGSGVVQDKFRPVELRYFSYDPANDNFKVLLDKGDVKQLDNKQAKEQTRILLKYFLIGLSLPDKAFWVNLRPDSEDQIIDQYLGKTDIGKIMLEADLQLKKDTASFTSPQTSEGREYWERIYKKAGEIYGNDNITIPTLTRPWIVPGEIIIRESKGSAAYVYKATLKVMLEQDYLKDSANYNFKDERAKELNNYSSQLIRELIIPKLTKEVNSSKKYSALRQVYYSLILSRWFKLRFTGKSGSYAASINTKDLTNLVSQEPWSKTTYFKEYQKSFAKGEYNIQEPVSTPTGQMIRSYFSGGMDLTSGTMAISADSKNIGMFNGSSDLPASGISMQGKGADLSTVEALNDQNAAVDVAAGQFADAEVAFSGKIAELQTQDILESERVKTAQGLENQGEEYKFTDPAEDKPVSRFGYKDTMGALRTKYVQNIVNWVEETKKIGGRVLAHIGIGGQGLSNSSEAEFWGENGESGDVIVLDRLGISVKKLFQDLVKKYGSIKAVVVDMSSKSGTTDEPAMIYQEILCEFSRLMAIENGMSESEAENFVNNLIKHFGEINKGKNGAALFTDINKDVFSEIEIKTLNDVFERMVFTTSANPATSRLYAFAMGLKKSGILNKDIAIFDFSEFTGGRFTQYCESGLTTLAWQGLPVIELNRVLRQQAKHYLGEEGNNPDKNSALRAAILAEELNPKVMIVAVRSSNVRFEALQKQQLFPESNGKNGMGSWVVVAVGEDELQNKIRDVKKQTGKNPLVIVIDQEGFIPMKVTEGVSVIRYVKEDISPFANAKFNLWFQEFTVRFGLLRSARMAVEHNLDLTIANVGAADMNKPDKSGLFWIFDGQNQPMVELAKALLVKALNTISKTADARKERYDQVEKVRNGEFFDQTHLADAAGTRSLGADEQEALLQEAREKIEANADKAEFKTVPLSSFDALVNKIRRLQQENRHLAAEMKEAVLANDQQRAMELQRKIEANDSELKQCYSDLAGVASSNLKNETMKNAAKQLAALMLISQNRGRLLAPLFYTAEPNADILGAILASVGLTDYGIGTTAQHANGQDRLDGSNATFDLLVDFVKSLDTVSAEQAQVRTFGLAKDELDGMLPDEVRRLFAEATYGALTGQASNKAIGYDKEIYDKRFYRDAALMRLPDISTNEGLMDAVSIFYMAFRYFDASNSGAGVVTKSPDANGSGQAGVNTGAAAEAPGGIDFRILPMTIQPMGSLSGLNFKLPQLSQAALEQIDINREMRLISNMVQSGILPSGERIKELVAACVQKGQINSYADNLLLCLADILKLEEENASESSPALKEALVIVNSQS